MAVGNMEITTARTQLALAYTGMDQHAQGNGHGFSVGT